MHIHILSAQARYLGSNVEVDIHLYNAFVAQARYLGSNVEVEINFDNAFLVQARYLNSNVEVKIFCRPLLLSTGLSVFTY